MLDVVVLIAGGLAGWLAVAADILLRRPDAWRNSPHPVFRAAGDAGLREAVGARRRGRGIDQVADGGGPAGRAAAAREGLSILIAPVSTLVPPGATGLPIVPIVIRNSASVAARNAANLNPSAVDIALLPLVSVENWSLRNLRERIEQIRAAYLATLSEWPAAAADTSDRIS